MSCIACETYPKRVSNVFRDAEIKEKYENLIGVKVYADCFICDACNDTLGQFLAFKEKCSEIFHRLYPVIATSESIIENIHEEHNDEHQKDIQENLKSDKNSFIIAEIFTPNCSEQDVDYVEVTTQKANESEIPTCDEEISEYEEIYLEFNDEDAIEEIQENKVSESPSKLNRKSYTAEEKLQIIYFAEENTNRLAARKYGINESTVRCFRKQKPLLLKMNPEKKSNRRATPHWPKLEAELKKFVLESSEATGTSIKMKAIREKAIELAQQHGISNFNGSNSFIFKFMQRNSIPAASPRPRKKS